MGRKISLAQLRKEAFKRANQRQECSISETKIKAKRRAMSEKPEEPEKCEIDAEAKALNYAAWLTKLNSIPPTNYTPELRKRRT